MYEIYTKTHGKQLFLQGLEGLAGLEMVFGGWLDIWRFVGRGFGLGDCLLEIGGSIWEAGRVFTCILEVGFKMIGGVGWF